MTRRKKLQVGQVGDRVVGIMGCNGGYEGTLTAVNGRECIFHREWDDKEWEDMTFNFLRVVDNHGQVVLKAHGKDDKWIAYTKKMGWRK